MSKAKQTKKPEKKTGRPSLGKAANVVLVQAKLKAATAAALEKDAEKSGLPVSTRLRQILEERYG